MRSRLLPATASAVWLSLLLPIAACDDSLSASPLDASPPGATPIDAGLPADDATPPPDALVEGDPGVRGALATRPEDGPDRVSLAIDAPHCSVDGWCWQAPWWSGDPVTLWSPAEGVVWGTAGPAGVIHRVDGAWRVALRLDGWSFGVIGGRGPDDVWVSGARAGRAALFHLEGERWVIHHLLDQRTQIHDITPGPDGGLFAITSRGLLAHHGGRWIRLSAPIGGVAGRRLTFDGEGAPWLLHRDDEHRMRLSRFEGDGWRDVTPDPADPEHIVEMETLWTDREGRVNAIGSRLEAAGPGAYTYVGALAARFDDPPRVWEGPRDELPSGTSDAVVDGLDTWLVGFAGLWLFSDGLAGQVDDDHRFGSIASPAPGRIWVGGRGGQIAELTPDGLAPMFATDAMRSARRIWADAAGQAWLAGRTYVARLVDGEWRPEAALAGRGVFTDVHGIADDAVWVVGEDGHAQFWDGAEWTRQPLPHFDDLRAVWAAGRDDARAVGCGISAFDGHRWSLEVEGTDCMALQDIDGSGPADIWAVGGGRGTAAALWHFDGVEWAQVPPSPEMDQGLRRVWSAEPGVVYVSDFANRLFRLDGEAWVRVPFEVVGSVHGIWGSAPDDVWVVGGGMGEVHRFDGVRWTPAHTPGPPPTDIFGAGERVWAVMAYEGYAGVYQHRRPPAE